MKFATPAPMCLFASISLAISLATISTSLFAEDGETADAREPACVESDDADRNVTTPAKNPGDKVRESGGEDALEVSFGSSLLFIEWPLLGTEIGDDAPMMAVHSVTLIVEWLVLPWMSLAVFGNIPVTPMRKWMGEVLVEEHAAPVMAVGSRISPIRFQPFRKAWFEPQVGLLLGRTFGSADGDRFFPFAVARMVLGTHEGATLYLGGGYGFSVDTFAVLYGLGHRF